MNADEITQLLDSKKSDGKFKVLVCSDEFVFGGVLQFVEAVIKWAETNNYKPEILPPTDPVILETGEERPNPLHKLHFIEFTPIN